MTLARWPNEGFVKIADVLYLQSANTYAGKVDKVGKFICGGDRPQRWVNEKDVWLHGYWCFDWAQERQQVESIDTEKRIISLVPPHHASGYRKGQWYYAFNLLPELDIPGEWVVDREKGILYFWPPDPVTATNTMVSVLPAALTLTDTAHVIVRDLTVEAARETAVRITGGTANRIEACRFRNIGGWAVRISGGTAHGVVGCEISATGDGGIVLEGGDRTTLTPAGHYAVDNHIHHYSRWNRTYMPAISLKGVGNRAANNLIHHAPHQGIAFAGNDHVIEGNEIHHVCTEANDAGAIYAGRDWTMRGTVIRGNFVHDVTGLQGRGAVAVYLDDMFSGTEIGGNLICRAGTGVLLNGGRDCRIENNVMVECGTGLSINAMGLDSARGTVEKWNKEAREKGTISGVAFSVPPYSVKYPALAAIVDQNPGAPRGNVVARNICWRGKWDGIAPKAKPFVTLEGNLVDQDPRFADAASGDYQLRDDSPAWGLGFKRIALDKIGPGRGQPPSPRPEAP